MVRGRGEGTSPRARRMRVRDMFHTSVVGRRLLMFHTSLVGRKFEQSGCGTQKLSHSTLVRIWYNAMPPGKGPP